MSRRRKAILFTVGFVAGITGAVSCVDALASRQPIDLLATQRSPLVLISGQVSPLPAGDGIDLGSGNFATTGISTIGHMASAQASTVGTQITGGLPSDTSNVSVDVSDLHTAITLNGVLVNMHGTADTTLGATTTTAFKAVNSTTKVAGVPSLLNIGFRGIVTNAAENVAFLAELGEGRIKVMDPNAEFADLHAPGKINFGGGEDGATGGNLTNGPYLGTPTFSVNGTTGDTKLAATAFFTQATTAVASENVISGLTLIGGEAASNNLYISTNSLSGEYNSNATDNLVLNFAGYHGGATQFRGIRIFDGKNVEWVKYQGDTHHIITTGPAVSFSAGAGCGTSPACNSGTCDDIAGTFTTGSATTACTLTFNGTYTSAANHSCIFTPIGTGTYPTLGAGTANTAVLSTCIASTQYSYICLGH